MRGAADMAGKWKGILLVASLALNLAFFSLYLHKKFVKKMDPANENGYEQSLKLKEKQQDEIYLVTKEFNVKYIKFKQDILNKRMEIIEELGDPEFNLELLEEKTNELNDLENQLNHSFVETLIQMNTILDSQQRLNFLYQLSKNWFFLKKDSSREKHD